MNEDVIHIDCYQDPPSHPQISHYGLQDLSKNPRAALETKGKTLPLKQGLKPLESQELPEGFMDRDMKEGVLEIHAAKPCILLDPITDQLKALHPEFVLFHSLVELLRVQYGSEFPRTMSLSHGKV